MRTHARRHARTHAHTHTHTHTTILWLSGFCPGQPGWAGTRRNIHPLTPIMVICHPLSASSIYDDLWHPPCDSIQSLHNVCWQMIERTSCPPTQVTVTGSGHDGHGRHTISMLTAGGRSHGPVLVDVPFSGSCANKEIIHSILCLHVQPSISTCSLLLSKIWWESMQKLWLLHYHQATQK